MAIFESAPNAPEELGIIGTREQILAVLLLQDRIAQWRRRLAQKELARREAAATTLQAAERGREGRVKSDARRGQIALDRARAQAAAVIQARYRAKRDALVAAARILMARRLQARMRGMVCRHAMREEAERREAERRMEEKREVGRRPSEAGETEAVAARRLAEEGAACTMCQESADCHDDQMRQKVAFVMRNLDTGESIEMDMPQGDRGSAVLSCLHPNKDEWERLKESSKGVLEKLAAARTWSFRSYQLCVWQERYVYADDSALCYQHLNGKSSRSKPSASPPVPISVAIHQLLSI